MCNHEASKCGKLATSCRLNVFISIPWNNLSVVVLSFKFWHSHV